MLRVRFIAQRPFQQARWSGGGANTYGCVQSQRIISKYSSNKATKAVQTDIQVMSANDEKVEAMNSHSEGRYFQRKETTGKQSSKDTIVIVAVTMLVLVLF
jgi:hypothetical protein